MWESETGARHHYIELKTLLQNVLGSSRLPLYVVGQSHINMVMLQLLIERCPPKLGVPNALSICWCNSLNSSHKHFIRWEKWSASDQWVPACDWCHWHCYGIDILDVLQSLVTLQSLLFNALFTQPRTNAAGKNFTDSHFEWTVCKYLQISN